MQVSTDEPLSRECMSMSRCGKPNISFASVHTIIDFEQFDKYVSLKRVGESIKVVLNDKKSQRHLHPETTSERREDGMFLVVIVGMVA